MSEEQLTHEEFTEMLSEFSIRDITDFQVQLGSLWMRFNVSNETYHLEFSLTGNQVWFQRQDGNDWVELYS